MAGTALVSIGIPTFNAAATIETTLQAVLAQDHVPLEIIVADNASSDDTVAICEAIAGDDPRCRVVVHDHNRGWQYNFRFLLAEASGPYFTWVGADDKPAPTFVSRNVSRLERDPALVTSVSRVRWLHGGRPGEPAAGTSPLVADVRTNVSDYLRRARDNSRFYGVHRTEVLRRSFPSDDFYGLDLAVMVGTLRSGGHGEVAEVLMELERSDPATYVQHIQRDASGLADLLLPMRGFNRSLVRELRVPLSPRAVWWLAVRNVFEHLRYWSTTGGPYGLVAKSLFARLDERRSEITRSDDEGNHREPR